MVDESTAEKQPASVSDDLSAAWDELESVEETNDKPEVEAREQSTDETPAGEAETEQASDSEKPEEEASAETPDETLTAPNTWALEDRDAFAAMPREAQEFLLRRHKEMTADYTRKTQEVASLRPWQQVDEQFNPYRQQLAAQGVSPQDYVQRLLAIDAWIAKNPQEGIRWLAQQRGVDLGESADEYTDPEIAKLRQQVGYLSQAIQGQKQHEQQAATHMAVNSIQQFADERDESGNPARPYFNDVLPDMIVMAQGMVSTGQQPDLDDLYNRAVRANPSTYAKVYEAQRKADSEKAQQEARRKAEEAKRADRSVSGGPMSTGNMVGDDLGIRETLEALWDQAS